MKAISPNRSHLYETSIGQTTRARLTNNIWLSPFCHHTYFMWIVALLLGWVTLRCKMCCAGLHSLGVRSEKGERLSHRGLWSGKPHGGWTSGQGDMINIITHLGWPFMFSLLEHFALGCFLSFSWKQVFTSAWVVWNRWRTTSLSKCKYEGVNIHIHKPSVLLTKQNKMMSLFC